MPVEFTPVVLDDDPTLEISLGDATDEVTERVVSAVNSEVPANEENQPFSTKLFYEGYSRIPTFIDQYERLPLTVKEGELKAEIFDLSDAKQLKAYNAILSDTTHPYSPRAVMHKVETVTTPTAWKMLVHYKPLWYKVLNKIAP